MAEQNHQFKDFEHTLTSEPMQRGMRFEKKEKVLGKYAYPDYCPYFNGHNGL
ncbi:Uncharacterised protein [Staphylococcus saprophyticus]|nr:Uncharacterised protein [Staphylococcus saprophyticus]SUM84524.1 Uncharacterised protein [Staphylococcus saprophyticus]